MKRNILIALSITLIFMVGCTKKTIQTPPNVIYILADDMGYGDLSCYGQQKLQTPNIDALAKEGMRFVNHYAGNTVCSPSRAVLMTGMTAGTCYIRGNASGPKGEAACALDSTWTVLPELFKNAGYATGAYGKWGLGFTNVKGDQNPLNHGFDAYCGWINQSAAHNYYPKTYVLNGQEIPLEEGQYIHDVIMNKAFDFIRESVKNKKPFFCYIPTAIPHAAMQAPKDLHEKWRGVLPQFDSIIGKYNAGLNEKCADVINPIAGFAAMIEHLDDQVGELMQMLKDLGVDENTLVIFSSDNGAHHEGGHNPEYWNSTGGLRGGKRDMHEGGIRVPMIARWPKVIAQESTTGLISSFSDVVPTMAELLQQDVPPLSKGISFLPTLKGGDKQEQHKYLFFEFHKGSNLFSTAIRMDNWKAYQEKGKAMELYNLSDDPYEKNDVSQSHPDLIKQFEAIILEASDPLTLREI